MKAHYYTNVVEGGHAIQGDILINELVQILKKGISVQFKYVLK